MRSARESKISPPKIRAPIFLETLTRAGGEALRAGPWRDRAIPALVLAVGILCSSCGAAASGARTTAKAALQQAPIRKKLIKAGWDEPEPAFMRAHLDQMERSPFDGCEFRVPYVRADGSPGSFTWEAWGKRKFTMEELEPALRDLQALHPSRFKYNFLRFNTTPADLDWFDDYSAVIENARLAARIAREGRCQGILLDIEEYQGKPFEYHAQRDAAHKSWEEYAAQARVRGRQVMEAFQDSFPGLTLFLSNGYFLPWANSADGKRPLADIPYGMLPPFLDGVIEAVQGDTRILEGGSVAFGYRDTSWLRIARRQMSRDLLPIVADPEKYRRVVSLGFSIWLDFDWTKRGWNTDDATKNFYSPRAFEATIRRALSLADEYVIVYSETPRWWSEERKTQKLPPEYDAVLRKLRREARLD